MAVMPIRRMGDPVLLARATPLAMPFPADLAMLVTDMIETMIDAGGVGLAAPQIGRSIRLFVYRLPQARAEPGAAEIAPRALVNPVLTPLSEEITEDVEGCLSLPELRGSVRRFTHIAYTGFDPSGEAISGRAFGYHARILQHEQDHLDGILYPMRMTDFRSFGYARELTRASIPDNAGLSPE